MSVLFLIVLMSFQGCLLLCAGRLADFYGRKIAFIIGISWFTVLSIGSGFANSLVSLVVLRALQGIGPAAFVPASVSGVCSQIFGKITYQSLALLQKHSLYLEHER